MTGTPTATPAQADLVRRAAEALRAASGSAPAPAVGIILGSGLSDALPELEDAAVLPYGGIPGFPRTTVAGHAGRLVLGRRGGVGVAAMQGRFHYYEGHAMQDIAFPIRVLGELGVRTLIVTSAVGSMRASLKPGHIAVLKDHINLMGVNPLRGPHEERFGAMFPDLLDAYDPALRKLALKTARSLKITAREGVYVAVSGPSYETPAEIRAFRRLGGDVVGMSTVPEVIAARQLGVKVLCLSWVANLASGLAKEPLSHPDVLSFGRSSAGRIRRLLENLLERL